MNHVPVNELPYCKPVKKWLMDRYGKETGRIWKQTVRNYNTYLQDLPDYGGKKNGHARAIYGGLLVFALYPALPDEPPISEMQEFVNNLFMGPFTKLGKIFNLNRSSDMWLIDKVFRKSGKKRSTNTSAARKGPKRENIRWTGSSIFPMTFRFRSIM